MNVTLNKFLKFKVYETLMDQMGVELSINDIVLQNTLESFEGHKTIVTFNLAKQLKKSPEDIANELGERLMKTEGNIIKTYNVVKGFLNLVLTDEILSKFVNDVNEDFGLTSSENKGNLMIEFSSPNSNKPLHLGHLRNNFIGDSMARILDAYGYSVEKVQLINDRGIHICATMAAWMLYGNNETPTTTNMKGDNFVAKYYHKYKEVQDEQVKELMENEGYDEEEAKNNTPIAKEAKKLLKKWEDEDPETMDVWMKMNGWTYEGMEETYEKIGVNFDKNDYESDTYLLGKQIVLKGVEEGVLYKKEDGSIWCDLSEYGWDDKLLLRGDGTSVYMTQDIGTAVDRFQCDPSLVNLTYVVGNEQDEHFQKLFKILGKLGYFFFDRCYHLSYGMVTLPDGSMKSREGNVVDADDIIKEMEERSTEVVKNAVKSKQLTEEERKGLYEKIGLGAIKYYLLSVKPKMNVNFDPDDSIDIHGNTGPYFQYSHARLNSLLQKAKENGYEELGELDYEVGLNNLERDILVKVFDFPEKVRESAEKYDPSIIANHMADLTRKYNQFYVECPVLSRKSDEGTTKNRLIISRAAKIVLKNSLHLLGIDAPDKT